MASTTPHLQTIESGGGRIVVGSHGSNVVFSELSSTYPLKLLSPRIAQDGVAVVYILSYGGGLVGGDSVSLAVDVGLGAVLVLLSQVCGRNRMVSVQDKANISLTGIHESFQNPARRETCVRSATSRAIPRNTSSQNYSTENRCIDF